MNAAFPIPSANEVHVWRTPATVTRLLSTYLGTSTDAVHLAKGFRGKPHISPAHGTCDLRFNVSHSGDLRLVAVASGREVGIDVQRFEDGPGLLDSLERFFTAAELTALDGMPPAERRRARMQIWAGKEAVLKATGEGIDVCVRQLDLAGLLSSGRAQVCRPMLGETSARVWSVFPMSAGHSYAGALAVEGRNAPAVLVRDWPAVAAA